MCNWLVLNSITKESAVKIDNIHRFDPRHSKHRNFMTTSYLQRGEPSQAPLNNIRDGHNFIAYAETLEILAQSIRGTNVSL